MVPNWRVCLEKATGEYYMILDDDNYLIDKTYLTKASNIFEKYSDTKLIFSNFKMKLKNGIVDRVFNLGVVSNGIDVYQNYFDYDKIQLIFFCILSTNTARKYSFYDQNIVTHDTQSFLISMLDGRVGFVDSFAGIYDLSHDDNLSHKLASKLKDYFLFHKKVIEIGNEKKIKPHILYRPLLRQSAQQLYFSLRLKKLGAFLDGIYILKESYSLFQLMVILTNALLVLPLSLLFKKLRLLQNRPEVIPGRKTKI